jgi:hypothetical protein
MQRTAKVESTNAISKDSSNRNVAAASIVVMIGGTAKEA